MDALWSYRKLVAQELTTRALAKQSMFKVEMMALLSKLGIGSTDPRGRDLWSKTTQLSPSVEECPNAQHGKKLFNYSYPPQNGLYTHFSSAIGRGDGLKKLTSGETTDDLSKLVAKIDESEKVIKDLCEKDLLSAPYAV